MVGEKADKRGVSEEAWTRAGSLLAFALDGAGGGGGGGGGRKETIDEGRRCGFNQWLSGSVSCRKIRTTFPWNFSFNLQIRSSSSSRSIILVC